jgi:hypothetical protein
MEGEIIVFRVMVSLSRLRGLLQARVARLSGFLLVAGSLENRGTLLRNCVGAGAPGLGLRINTA